MHGTIRGHSFGDVSLTLASEDLDWCKSEQQGDELPHTFLWEDFYLKAKKTVRTEGPVKRKEVMLDSLLSFALLMHTDSWAKSINHQPVLQIISGEEAEEAVSQGVLNGGDDESILVCSGCRVKSLDSVA